MTVLFAVSWLTYLLIPLSSGLIGWGTNVLAIKMMFAPLEFVGKRPFFGWQGIIPAKARKMANNIVELVLSRLLSVEEMFSRIEPKRVSQELGPILNKMTESIVEEVIAEAYPRLWESVPRSIKERTYARVQQEIPRVIEEILEEVELRIEEICDIQTIVVDAFVKNKALLNELFLRCGAEEFKFIGRSGLYFGMLFGLVQMGVWILFPRWWLLPLAGLFVGYATNWLALKMVFEPLEPVKFGPLVWQGLFLKRQKEVSQEYATVFAEQILNSKNLLEQIIRGPSSDRLFLIVQRHLKRAVDESSGIGKPLIQFVVGTERYIAMKQTICDRLLEGLIEQVPRLHQYTDEVLDIKEELKEKLQALSAHEFEQVLHPIFQEDEWILIAVGAVLGMAAGFGQLFLLFGGGS